MNIKCTLSRQWYCVSVYILLHYYIQRTDFKAEKKCTLWLKAGGQMSNSRNGNQIGIHPAIYELHCLSLNTQ